jgi:hypothetical protein
MDKLFHLERTFDHKPMADSVCDWHHVSHRDALNGKIETLSTSHVRTASYKQTGFRFEAETIGLVRWVSVPLLPQ